MSAPPVIVWFRRDLRFGDNPALSEAVATGRPVAAVWIADRAAEGAWLPGPASRWWLERSLLALDASLAEAGRGRSGLLVRAGEAADVLTALAAETGADEVFASRLHEPAAVAAEPGLAEALRCAGVRLRLFDSGMLCEPEDVLTAGGAPMRIFTPFWNRCAAAPPREPLPAPQRIRLAESAARTGPDAIAASLAAVFGPGGRPLAGAGWHPGEVGARTRLRRFIDDAAAAYADDRDAPARDGTSLLSPHMHFGEISARSVISAVRATCDPGDPGPTAFLRQVYWREFAHHLLRHFPDTPERPLRPEFERFPWRDDPRDLEAWTAGMTGYPFVDAGMRQLAATGWMHNRARLVVASFLTKDLLIPWQSGARVFWERLVDADLADNTLGWQWTAGCGADAAPYFRIFNPVLQAQRFDPEGAYVRRWVPELAGLSGGDILRPWAASPGALSRAGSTLERDYPLPLVDHAEARLRALAAYASIRG